MYEVTITAGAPGDSRVGVPIKLTATELADQIERRLVDNGTDVAAVASKALRLTAGSDADYLAMAMDAASVDHVLEAVESCGYLPLIFDAPAVQIEEVER